MSQPTSRIGCCLLALAVTACHGAPTARKPAAASARPVAATAAPGSTAAASLLRKPAGDVRAVSGQVQLEAHYALAHGATLLSDNGAGVLSLGDASVIANNAGNLIANNAGNLLSDNGAGYRLMAATELAIGTQLPAAGMAVGVQDLVTGQLLALGQDSAGKPATAVLTDARGRFQVYVPASATGSLRVVGAPAAGSDDRLRTALLARSLDQPLTLDDDSAVAAAFVRAQLSARTYHNFTASQDEIDTEVAYLGAGDATLEQALKTGVAAVGAIARQQGIDKLPDARREAIADRMTDIVLARLDLDAITVDRALPPALVDLHVPEPAADEPHTAHEMVGHLMSVTRENIGATMQRVAASGQDPAAYFAAKPYLQDAAARDGHAYPMLKPSDFNDFIIRGVLTNPRLDDSAALLALATIFADPDVHESSMEMSQLIRAEFALQVALARKAFQEPGSALPELEAAMKAMAP